MAWHFVLVLALMLATVAAVAVSIPGGVEQLMCWLLPHRDIMRDGKLYLRRFYLTPRFLHKRLFLHHIILADPDPHMHDHPWAFKTRVIRGGYLENFYRPGKDGGPGMHGFSCLVGRDPSNASVAWPGWHSRDATYRHKITQVFGDTWTLVVAAQAEREWGFWVDRKFVPWFEYLQCPNEVALEDKVLHAR